MAFYSFDTSSILNGRRDLFPPKTFVSVWACIEDLILSGSIRSVDEVKRELDRKSDDASKWAATQTNLFVPLDLPIQRAAKEILKVHPRMTGVGGKRNGADPFVIALAQIATGTVVTEETPKNLTSPHIPDVCEAIGVRCIRLTTFLEEQGRTF